MLDTRRQDLALEVGVGARVVVTDVETTGIGKGDRIVEVACVTLDLDDGVIDEWSTLVNPMRDISHGVTSIHKLAATDVSAAPTFEEIEPLVTHSLQSGVVAGHNISFDIRMLEYEYERLGTHLELEGWCTMHAASAVGAKSRKLAECCETIGLALVPSHDALGDARAAAHLLLAILAKNPAMASEIHELAELHKAVPYAGRGALPRTYPRVTAASHRTDAYLRSLIEALPVHPELSREENAYLAILDHALDDFILTEFEREHLAEFAADLGLSGVAMRHAHVVYLEDLHHAAMRDGQISPLEREQLDLVADALHLEHVPHHHSEDEMIVPPLLPGACICFTGDAPYSVDGVRWTRLYAHDIAESAGYTPVPSVSRKCQLVVAADPNTMSGKAQKARNYGIAVVSVPAFLDWLGFEYEAH